MTHYEKSPMWVNPSLSPMHIRFREVPSGSPQPIVHVTFSHEAAPNEQSAEMSDVDIPMEPDAPIAASETAEASGPEPEAPDTTKPKPARRKVSKPRKAKETKTKK